MSSDLTSIQSQFNINGANPDEKGVYEFENFRLDAVHLMLYRDEEPLALAPKVVETLVALVERRGEIVSKNEMMERLWKNSFVEEANLTQNIYLLRKTLGRAANGCDLIETFRRRGYRFTGELKNPAKSKEKRAGAAVSAETAAPTENAKGAAREVFDSLAVLPLANESKDETTEYLSDGITESVINRLSQLGRLRVVARHTAFRYKNREVEPREVGRALGVSAVLTGRVMVLGERLIVRAELVDAANGWQIWGEQYDRLFSDVLELQEIIAREISEKLDLKLSREEQRSLAKRHTESSEAYDLYVKGRYFLNKRLTETIQEATDYFQRAIDADSNYALAYVGLADCFPLLSLYGALTPHEAYPKAEAAARKALEIDPLLAEAYNSLGVVKLFYEWDWRGAENAFREAIRLNPNYADAHQRYGMLLTANSRFTEAVAEFEKAKNLDPLSLIIKTISGYPFYYGRQFERAEACFREVIEMDETYSMAHFRLGLTYSQEKKFDEAIIELGKSTALSRDRDVVAALGYVYGLKGEREKWEEALAELAAREKEGFVSAYNRAVVYAGAGEAEIALDWLERAFEERSYWLIYLKSDPSLDALRGNPRFAALEEKIFGAEDRSEIAETSHPFADTERTVSPGKRLFGFPAWYSVAALGILLAAAWGLMQLNWRFKSDAAQNARTGNISLKRLTPDIDAASPAISPDGKYLVYIQLEKDTRSIWLKDIATGSAKQIMPPTTAKYEVTQFSPDGKQIYFATSRENVPNGVIVRIPLTGGMPQDVAQNVTSPFALSPDGKQLAFVRVQSLIVAEADGGGERVLKERDGKNSWFESWGSQLSWSPDGRAIAICGGRLEHKQARRELTEISAADASERKIPVPEWDYLDGVQWLPDGSGLMVIARETSGEPFQIWRVAYPSGEAARITQDFLDYKSISISADSRRMIANQEIGNRNIWIGPLSDARAARQITSGTAANDGFWGVSLMPDGRVVYTSPRSGNWDLWMTNPDGSNQKQLTANAGSNSRPDVSSDGRFIFFVSNRGNTVSRIWRIDADGGNPRQMTDGEGSQDRPFADDQWVYFNWSHGTAGSIWKVPIEGGKPVPVLTEGNVAPFSLSPDGSLLVFQRYDETAAKPWQFGVARTDTGQIVKMFDQPMAGGMRWTADSKSLIYIESGKALNLWQQALSGGAPRALTNFETGQLRAFDISPDGKTLVVSRGNTSHEAVLITNF